MSRTRFDSDRSWDFTVSPDALWDRLTNVADYSSWWPWLEQFQPVGGFQAGARWACTVSPPLPYLVHFSVLLDDVEQHRFAHARVVGDIEGDASLTIEPSESGCTARLRSQLAPANPLLRGVGAAARPVIEWGHDWVLDQGQRQFVNAASSPVAGTRRPPGGDAGRRRTARRW